jgi:hypothetical protein
MYTFIKWLLRKGRLAKAIIQGRLEGLLGNLVRNLHRVCKQKRKRFTTEQLLDDQIPYMDSFHAPRLGHFHELA